jgi:histidinol dehydrogenase
VGPGNVYVQQAKRQLSSTAGIDSFAGPSDLMVILGSQAGAEATRMAALDMLAQAEHGPGSLVVGAACDAATAESLCAQLAQALDGEPRATATAAVVHVTGAARALELANAFAPEHLQLIGADVEARAGIVTAAGCVFLGAGSATAFGDYVAGSNHILPTGGAARFASGLSARHFRRRMAEVRIGDDAAASLAAAGAPIARAEGFEWHARSMEARIREN